MQTDLEQAAGIFEWEFNKGESVKPKDYALIIFVVSFLLMVIGGKMDDKRPAFAGGGGCFLIATGLIGFLGTIGWAFFKLSGLAWSAL